jgi:glucosylglycerol 3-phosphatase
MPPTNITAGQTHLHDRLTQTQNLLLIQDLDGVCMNLVNDPRDRQIDPTYLRATQAFAHHFYVLTNGEHTGPIGVNSIIDRAIQPNPWPNPYLPGLAAGGIQWQDRSGCVEHPGVQPAELEFLATIPTKICAALIQFCTDRDLDKSAIETSILANIASPTVNLNRFYELLKLDVTSYQALQKMIYELLQGLIQNSEFPQSFFLHCAPNLGANHQGEEIPWWGSSANSGTTDFQFMLRGGVKEAGVLVLLNRYYGQHYGDYPLGAEFNVRQAPQSIAALLNLTLRHFDHKLMPTIVGVGDTVTSNIQTNSNSDIVQIQRGGSDRNFLQFIQELGIAFDRPNLTVYVDSSGGELSNRKPLKIDQDMLLESPTDPDDPLKFDVFFPGGHREYCQHFCQAAAQRFIHCPE